MSNRVILDIETFAGERPDFELLPTPLLRDFKAPANYKDESKKLAYIQKTYQKALEGWEGKARDLASEHDKAWRKQALVPEVGEIVCIGVAIDEDEPVCVDTPSEFYDVIKHVVNPVFIGHNIRKFDAPWIFKHSIRDKVKVPVGCHFDFNKYRGNIEDTMEMWACEVYNSYTKLDIIAKFLGVGQKTKGVDGAKVHDYYLEGRIDEIKEYCKDDVRLTRAIYKRIKGIE